MRTDQQSLQQKRHKAAPPSVGNLNRSAGILASMLFIYAVAISWHSWTTQMAQSVNELTTIATLEARAIDSYFVHLEYDLKSLGENLARKGEHIDLEQAYVQVRRFNEIHPELFNVTLIQANGDILLTAKNPPGTTRVSLAKEISFINFIEELKQGTLSGIGQPLVGVVSKAVIVPVRYAIKDRQGNLRHIVSANLPHEHLRSFWMDAPVTEKAAIGLMRDNGFLLSRYPVPVNQPLDQIYGKPRTGALINHLQQQGFPVSGHVQGPSSLDGPDFLTAFQRLSNSPVTLFVAMPISEIRGLWLRTVSGTYFALVLLLLGGFAAYRHALRRQYAESLEQQRLDESWRESEMRLRSILEASPVPNAVNDAQHNITYLNAAFTATFGYSQADIPTLEEWWPKAYPDPEYRQWVATTWQARMEKSQCSNKSFEPLELQITAKDGAVRTVLCTASPLGSRLDDSHLVTLYDMMEHHEALAALHENEERFRQAFAQSPIGMLLCQLDGHVFKANAAFCRMSGYDDDEIIGHRLGDLAPQVSTADEEIALFAKIASGEIADFSVQQEQVHKDGHIYVVQSSISLVRSSTNAPLYCLAHVEDLTERQRHQFEALAKQALSVQEEERTRLSRELHDDVGQSLTALKLMLRRVQQNCGHGQATECLRQASEATEHLMADVRAIAYRLRPSQLDDLGLMSSLRWHLDKVARPAGLEVVLSGNLGNERLPEALELCCFRVVQEALTNVLKHACARELEVSLNRVDTSIFLTLRDNGTGFDVTRHYLVPDNSRSLGLIGMRERVAAMGGRLEVKSSPGQGTEIRASFPVP
jgi:PAS domain S-box-containing protein